jgi:hypothetical protein
VSTTEIERSLRQAAGLRARVEQLEREERLAHRVLSFATAALTALVVILLFLDGWLAFGVFHPGS